MSQTIASFDSTHSTLGVTAAVTTLRSAHHAAKNDQRMQQRLRRAALQMGTMAHKVRLLWFELRLAPKFDSVYLHLPTLP